MLTEPAVRATVAALVVALGALACGGGVPPAATTTSTGDGAVVDAAALDAALTPYLESYGQVRGEAAALSGYVLVRKGDRTLYGRGFGRSDRARGELPGPDTSFRIGSTSKQFTAAAILVLVQDGVLELEAPVSRYLPEYPAVGADITLLQLLSHTGGLPEYLQAFAPEDFARPHTTAELLATFWELPLDFAPGTAWSYSNSGYLVLGAIIERVTGTPYAEVMRTRVFTPAGLTDTTVGDAEAALDRAIGYRPVDGALVPALPIDMSVPFAAGAVRSTANDLARWHHVLQTDVLLSAASRQRLTTEVRDGYALGWFVGTTKGHATVDHGGNIPGFNTGYARIPELDLVVVAWSNNEAVSGEVIADAALAAALGETPTPVVERAVVALDLAAAARLAGTYVLDEASRAAATKLGVSAETITTIERIVFAIDDADGAPPALTMKPIGQDLVRLAALNATTYELDEMGVEVRFELPADGAATAATVLQGPLTLRYQRQP
ncbi:MAG: serine hydrolase domain-containing protein [Kofleriaceae bacterium]